MMHAKDINGTKMFHSDDFLTANQSHWRASCPDLFFTAGSTYRSKFCQVKTPVLLGSSSSIADSKAVNETLDGNFDEGPALVECFEFENSPNSIQSVKVRLKAHFASWTDALGVTDFILRVTGKGYAIPFLTFPPNAFFDNNHSALMHTNFVLEAIQELILSGSVVQVSSPPVCFRAELRQGEVDFRSQVCQLTYF